MVIIIVEPGGLETIVALKRESKDPKDQYRLQILEETLRRMKEKNKDDYL